MGNSENDGDEEVLNCSQKVNTHIAILFSLRVLLSLSLPPSLGYTRSNPIPGLHLITVERNTCVCFCSTHYIYLYICVCVIMHIQSISLPSSSIE
eukprot:sb/3479276/